MTRFTLIFALLWLSGMKPTISLKNSCDPFWRKVWQPIMKLNVYLPYQLEISLPDVAQFTECSRTDKTHLCLKNIRKTVASAWGEGGVNSPGSNMTELSRVMEMFHFWIKY